MDQEANLTRKRQRQESHKGQVQTRTKRIQGNKLASQNIQKPREKRRANSTPERKQVKRDSGARTTAPKQSQQPGNPRPGRWPKLGNAIHRKLREMAETLIHPRLKTEWGNSPCPIAAEKTTREKNQANKREGTGRKNPDRNTFRERSHRPRGKVPPTEVLKAKQTRQAKRCRTEPKHRSSYVTIPRRTNGQQDGEAAPPWTAGTQGESRACQKRSG